MTLKNTGKLTKLGRARRRTKIVPVRRTKSSQAGQSVREVPRNPVLQEQTRGGPVVVLPSSSAQTGALRRALRPAFEGKS